MAWVVPPQRGTSRDVTDLEVLDRLNELLGETDDATVATSMRLPSALRDAAALAVERLGVAASATTLIAGALRSVLETAVMQAALEAHYRRHPGAQPALADVALALAVEDGSPLANRPDVIVRAAAEVVTRHPGADANDVLLWALAQQAVRAEGDRPG